MKNSLFIGQFFVENLCVARPDLIKSAINSLLIHNRTESSTVQPFINGLLSLYPQSAAVVQSTCLKQKTHPDMALSIITEQTDAKFITTMEMIFIQKNETSKWITSQFQNILLIDANTIRRMKEKMMSIIGQITEKLDQKCFSKEIITFGLAALHVWCVMKTSLNIRFSIEESSKLMNLFEKTVNLDLTPTTIDFILCTVSIAVSYPDFSAPGAIKGHAVDGDNLTRLSNWLLLLMNKCTELAQQSDFSGPEGSLAEFLLILGIHFHFEERLELEALTKKQLRIEGLQIKSLTIQRLKTLFTQQLYKTDTLSRLAISVPPTVDLSAHNEGFIPLHAVLHLLKTRQFAACDIRNVGDWIFDQIKMATLPVHPHLYSVIATLVRTNVPETKKDFDTLQKPIDYQKVASVACDDTNSMLVRSLVTYYIVTFAATLMKHAELVYRSDRLQLRRIPFPSDALRTIPIKLILSYTEKESSLRQTVYPSLLAAVSYILPELLIFETIPTQINISHQRTKTDKTIDRIVAEFESGMAAGNYQDVSRIIGELEKFSDMSILHFWSTDRVFKHIRNPTTPRWLLVSIKNLWLRLLSLMPRNLWTETLNRFNDNTKKHKLNEYMADPLLAFQANEQIFRSPTLLEMFLTSLRGVMKSSSSFYTLTMLTDFRVRNRKDTNQNDLNDCEKIKANILVTQKAAVVQILLEVMLPQSKDTEDSSLG